MSTREIAYQIFQKLNEEELQGFIALFKRAYLLEDDDMKERQAAFVPFEAQKAQKTHAILSAA